MRGRVNKEGFTLIELLVVIAVIAILLGILVPVLGQARMQAKKTVCQAHLRSAAFAFRMYLDDNRQLMPPTSEGYRAATEKMDPVRRAHVLELKEAIRARMDERGIDLGK